jgi:beta-xylosidase
MLELALIVTTLLAATSAAAQPGRTGETCTLAPAIASDFPDPSILYDPALNGEVFAYATNIATAPGGLLNVPVSRSVDPRLKQWSAPTDALPRLPGWARGSYTWAPAVAHRPGEPYRLYFTARYGFSGRPCIGVAVSQGPTGPFTPTSETKPLVCPLGEGGAIDPSIFKEEDGSEYLLWKTDSNCCEGVPTLYIQQLAPDGLSLVGPNSAEAPWLLPDATPLIHADQPWEGRVIEAPTLLKHQGRYDLFYSGGDYASNRYAVGYASAASLFGPYQKAAGPILSSSTSGLQGPGGQDVFAGPDGETWIAFHAWQGPPRYRALYFGQIVWTGGSPNAALQCADPAPAPPPH